MNFKEKLSLLYNKFTLPTLIGSLVFTLTVVGLFVLIFNKPTNKEAKTVSAADLATDLFPESAVLTGEYPAFPEVLFDEYDLNTSIPVTPSAVNIYTFKANYTLPETLEFAKKFGFNNLNQKEISETATIIYDNQTQESRGIFIFDHQTGSFSFQSFGVHKPKEVAGFATPESIAQSYLSELGLWDDTLVFTTTYELDGLSGITSVEFHRDWNKVGLPILNIVGLLNIPESKRLTDIALASQDSRLPDDSSIVNVSNGLNGKQRPNDFNTITVAVTDDGRILSINSSLRKQETVNSTSNLSLSLKTPQEALAELKQDKGIFSLTTPTGEGSLDFSKLYPQNIAHGKEAIINDFVLTYLEKANGIEQQFFQPMYIFRGTSTLNSGYHVQFVQAVPAVKTQTITNWPLIKNAFAQETTNDSCPAKGTTVEIPGLGTVTTDEETHTFYYIPKTTKEKARSIEEIQGLFFNMIAQQYTISVARKLSRDSDLLASMKAGTVNTGSLYELFATINYSNEIIAEKCPKVPQGDVAPVVPPLSPSDSCWNRFFISQMEQVVGITVENLVDIFTKPVSRPSFPIPTPTPTSIPSLTPTSTPIPSSTPTLLPTPTVTPTVTPTLTPTSTPTPTPIIFEPLTTDNVLNNLRAWAKTDIFPKETLRNFVYVFHYVPERAGRPHACPYITGVSPSIYIYPEKTQTVKVKIKPTNKITYVDPKLLNEKSQVWQVIASPNGELEINGLFRTRLYYEYKKINFPESKRGWVIERKNLDVFLKEELFPKLGLNQKEANDLLTDVRTSLMGSGNSAYLKISLIDEAVVDRYLPLTISPAPDTVHRIHLMLTLFDNPIETTEPTIVPIDRSGFTVVETGVVINN